MSKLAVMPLEDYQNACNTIRQYSEENQELIKSGQMPNKIYDVHEHGYMVGNIQGYADGKKAGYNEGYADGKEAGGGDWLSYDEFWDIFQVNGERRWYWGAFTGEGWTDETFKPKYPIIVDSVTHNYMFRNCRMTHLPKITIEVSSIAQVFYDAKELKTIFLALPNGGTSFNATFQNNKALENLTIEGEIGGSGLNLQWSTKLTKASWISIINALSSTTSGLSMTGSLASVQKAFETSEGANDGDTSSTWLNLKATKSNWGISLL